MKRNKIKNETQNIKNLLYLGHLTKKVNVNMFPYLLTIKENYHIISLEKTLNFLKLSTNIIKKFNTLSGQILFIGTDFLSRSLISYYAQKTHSSYINARWIGGFLTNWLTNKQQIKRLRILEKKLSLKYISLKKFNLDKKKVSKLQQVYVGVKNLHKLPKLVIFTNPKKDLLALNECLILGIPIIALTDTIFNPELISYPIPLNTNCSASINFMLKVLSSNLK
jgi:small subunit ribosomal protein S2